MRLLLVEDNPGDLRFIREMLAETRDLVFELETRDSLAAARERLQQGSIDLVLLDLGLPDSRGFDTFVETLSAAPEVPIVVLTGLYDEELAVKAVAEGAQDYLVKGQFDRSLLVRAIRYARERKRIERALQESEERYRMLADSAQDFIYIVNRARRIEYVNPCAAAELGCEPGDIIGRPLAELFPGQDAEPQFRHFEQVFQTGQPRRLQYSVRFPRRELWLDTWLVPVKTRQGQVHTVLAIAKDITDSALARERRLTDAALNHGDAIVIVLDPQNRIVRCNRNCERRIGCLSPEIEGQEIGPRFLRPEEWRQLQPQLAAIRRKNSGTPPFSSGGEEAGVTPPVSSWTCNPVSDEQGRLEYIIVTGSDENDSR